jgi:hypothetical protein
MINQIKKQADDIRSLKVTSVKGGTLATAILVAIKEIAQRKQAILNAALADRGTLSVVATVPDIDVYNFPQKFVLCYIIVILNPGARIQNSDVGIKNAHSFLTFDSCILAPE